MRSFFAGVLCLAAVVSGDRIPVNAAVIASCGPMEGYSYFYRNELADNAPCWEQASLMTAAIFQVSRFGSFCPSARRPHHVMAGSRNKSGGVPAIHAFARRPAGLAERDARNKSTGVRSRLG